MKKKPWIKEKSTQQFVFVQYTSLILIFGAFWYVELLNRNLAKWSNSINNRHPKYREIRDRQFANLVTIRWLIIDVTEKHQVLTSIHILKYVSIYARKKLYYYLPTVQCGKLANILQLRFYVNSMFVSPQSQNLQFQHM